MRLFDFKMAICAERTERIYRGNARYILVKSDEGLTLQLPASNFRRFVDAGGIQGRFRVQIDADNKIVSLERT